MMTDPEIVGITIQGLPALSVAVFIFYEAWLKNRAKRNGNEPASEGLQKDILTELKAVKGEVSELNRTMDRYRQEHNEVVKAAVATLQGVASQNTDIIATLRERRP